MVYLLSSCRRVVRWRGWAGLVLSVFSYLAPLSVIAFCYFRIVTSLNSRADAKVARRRGGGQEDEKGLKSGARRGTLLTPSINVSRVALQLKRQRRTNRMLIAMVVMFGTCWFPFILLNVVRDLVSPLSLSASLSSIPAGAFLGPPAFCHEQQRDLRPTLHPHRRRHLHCQALFPLHCSVWVRNRGPVQVWNPVLYAYLNEQFRAAFLEIIHCGRRLPQRCRHPLSPPD